MHNNFGNYSRYYDLLYRDKEYATEASYILDSLELVQGNVKSLLELGCGTGRHAEVLTGRGVRVVGVERSSSMLDRAKERAGNCGGRFEVFHGDVRSYRHDEKFDSVISLFHVASYQSANTDFDAILKTARSHLELGGYFLFDVWYGPAVLTSPPEIRVKRMEDENTKVVRIAEPTMRFRENSVDVKYTVFVTDKALDKTETFVESHLMRYFFDREIELFAGLNGFVVENASEWLTRKEPSENTWGVMYVLKAN